MDECTGDGRVIWAVVNMRGADLNIGPGVELSTLRPPPPAPPSLITNTFAVCQADALCPLDTAGSSYHPTLPHQKYNFFL